MVPDVGVAPTPLAYETNEILLLQPGINYAMRRSMRVSISRESTGTADSAFLTRHLYEN